MLVTIGTSRVKSYFGKIMCWVLPQMLQGEWREKNIGYVLKNACSIDFKKHSPIPRDNKKLACGYISIMEMLNNFVLELKNAHPFNVPAFSFH